MRNRACPPPAAILSLVVTVMPPAQASPVRFADVVQMIKSGRVTDQDLRLRTITQTSSTPATNGATSSTTINLPITTLQQQQGTSGTIQTIEVGDISGTICDCGEIAILGAGFPKFPLLALAAIPLAFLGSSRSQTPLLISPIAAPLPTPLPTPVVPTVPPTPVPEPATLLLFGSGLAALSAYARRRLSSLRTQETNHSASMAKED